MLTERNFAGDWWIKGIDWNDFKIGKTITNNLWQVLYGALFKLHDYEDIGLEPDEVREMAERNSWIPIEEALPEPGEYVLVSFSNVPLPDIGRYEEDEDGGVFYPGDEEYTYSSIGAFVNAWMQLPERYKDEDR